MNVGKITFGPAPAMSRAQQLVVIELGVFLALSLLLAAYYQHRSEARWAGVRTYMAREWEHACHDLVEAAG